MTFKIGRLRFKSWNDISEAEETAAFEVAKSKKSALAIFFGFEPLMGFCFSLSEKFEVKEVENRR
jgi:hypothetical protein